MIWAGLALMIALALGFLLPPVLRVRRVESGTRADYDLAVYRDQLKELETDLARGTVTAAEAAEAKLEIERRLLRAAPRGATERSVRSRIAGPIVALGVPVLAVAIYLAIGAPHVPGRASGGQTPVAGGGAETAEFTRMAERLAAKLAENPDSPEEWRLLGRTYMELGRYGEAANAFRQGQRLIPTDADLPTMLGEALVLNAENTVTPAAVAAFEQTLKLEPRHPIARYYLGLGRLQAGADKEAFDQWLELAKESQPDAPWMRVLPGQLAELAKQLKIDLAAAWPQQSSSGPIAGAKGPSAEQMQAAGEMSAEDRQQFIRSMVERLADRLKDNPNDLDGWQRLARAYRVLGDNDKAGEAEKRIAELQGGARPMPAPGTSAPPPGPTQEQMQAAAQMPTEDRSQMIRGMVERLAEKLRDNPNDFEGWTRLGRSYFVLGERGKAVEAYAKAASLKPEDPIAVANHAQAIAEAGDPRAPLPAESIRLFRDVLKMDALNPQALWAVGLAESQAGDRSGALEKWRRLLGRLPPDTPEFAQLQRRIADLEKATQ
jgi:cytochrome c-type biogenesis protein CcmH